VLRARVTDGADLLPPAAEARLESALAELERETSHQIAVLTVPGLEGEPIESFALRVAEGSGLGQRGLDNGILFVVAARERRARIEVGYGLEGVVPDAVAKRVLEDTVFPRFRAGDMAGGIEAGALALASAARGEVVPAERRPRTPGAFAPTGLEPLAAVGFAVLLPTLLVLPLRARRRRGLPAALAGGASAFITWLLLASLAQALLAGLLGAFFGALGPDVGDLGPRRRRRRRGGFFAPGGGGFGGGFGGGGFSGGGGGFSGGGGGFGGGGASGSW
jgi:uncharacterized protein